MKRAIIARFHGFKVWLARYHIKTHLKLHVAMKMILIICFLRGLHFQNKSHSTTIRDVQVLIIDLKTSNDSWFNALLTFILWFQINYQHFARKLHTMLEFNPLTAKVSLTLKIRKRMIKGQSLSITQLLQKKYPRHPNWLACLPSLAALVEI